MPFLVLSAVLTLILGWFGWKILTVIGIVLTLFIAWFFRNPKRNVPPQKSLIVSPADGKIVHAAECREDRFLKEKALKVSIFMSVFDAHVNRAPASATILEKKYHPGRFLVASTDKSSLLNEHNALLLETEDRLKILLVQIAGFIARRIVCYAGVGERLKKGEIFGMIRFGSRVDLYLPTQVKLAVKVGQHVKAGESIIGYRQ